MVLAEADIEREHWCSQINGGRRSGSILDQRVVSRSAVEGVGTTAAEEEVVAGFAGELVVGAAACELVVAIAAEEIGLRQRAVGFVQRDNVIAVLTEDLDQLRIGD